MWRLGVAGVLLAAALQSAAESIILDNEEYNQLPKLYDLDHYANCLVEPGNAYCLATFDLTSPKPSKLFDVMQMISKYKRMNFDHTKLHRGVCVTKKCSKFLNTSSKETSVLVAATEVCVNETIYNEFGFEAHLSELLYCKRTAETLPLDLYDWLFTLVAALLVLLNLAGTLYDFLVKEPNEKGIPWLMAFSVRVSWAQLTVIRSDADGDPRLVNLKSIQGLRTLTMFLVVMSHVIWLNNYKMPPDNPHFVELGQTSAFIALLSNGLLLMQTFMMIASFLLAYNFLIFRETNRFSWKYLFNAIVQRFLRLTPTYMLVVSFLATWGPRMQTGPLCPVLEDERVVCRSKWWLHLFYVHNVINAAEHCIMQSWYLGADMQLFLLGVTIMLFLWRYPGLTRPLLGVGLLLATAAQFVMVYHFGLNPLIRMQSPENLRTMYKNEPSFRFVYTSFQGNTQGYLIGLILGIAYYKWEKEGLRIHETNWFKVLHLLTVPVGFCWILAGYFVAELEHDEEHRLALALYAMVDRLFYCVLGIFMLLGIFWKTDSLYKRILEWRGFQAMGRLSYAVLLLHTITYFNVTCSMNYPREIGFYTMTNDWFGNLAMTYILAVPLALLVEFPLHRLTKALQPGSAIKHKDGGAEVNDAGIRPFVTNVTASGTAKGTASGTAKGTANVKKFN